MTWMNEHYDPTQLASERREVTLQTLGMARLNVRAQLRRSMTNDLRKVGVNGRIYWVVAHHPTRETLVFQTVAARTPIGNKRAREAAAKLRVVLRDPITYIGYDA